jgi:hypothetical protein
MEAGLHWTFSLEGASRLRDRLDVRGRRNVEPQEKLSNLEESSSAKSNLQVVRVEERPESVRDVGVARFIQRKPRNALLVEYLRQRITKPCLSHSLLYLATMNMIRRTRNPCFKKASTRFPLCFPGELGTNRRGRPQESAAVIGKPREWKGNETDAPSDTLAISSHGKHDCLWHRQDSAERRPQN